MGAAVDIARRVQGEQGGTKVPSRSVSRRCACRCLLLLLLLPGMPRAEASLRDMTVMARAMAFLESPPSGLAVVGIAFPRASEEGEREAGRLAAAFGDGLRSGRAILIGRPVPIEDLSGQRFAAVLLTTAALPHAREAAAVAGRGVLTVATDRAPVDAGIIMLAIRAEPQVEIIANRAAAAAAGIRFATAFRMLIQER